MPKGEHGSSPQKSTDYRLIGLHPKLTRPFCKRNALGGPRHDAKRHLQSSCCYNRRAAIHRQSQLRGVNCIASQPGCRRLPVEYSDPAESPVHLLPESQPVRRGVRTIMDGESRRTGCMLWQHCIDPVLHWGLRPRRGPPYARATRGRTESERCASMASRKERMGSSVRGEGKEVGGDSATGRAYMSCLHSNPGPCDAMQRWLACPTVARIGSEPILSCHAPLLRIPRDHPPPYFRACLRVAQRSLRPRKPCTHLQALQWPCPRRTMARPDFLPAADHDLSSRTAQLCTERPDGRRNIRTCPTWIPLSTDRNRRQSPKNP